MGRAPCCDKASVKKGPWSPEEDARLKSYIEQHGTGGNWIALPQKIGLKRCGKSCRLRWLNYLRPNIKHGGFSEEEDRIILSLYISIGSRWSIIAAQLPGRTDNDIKNYWNTKLKKRLFGKQSRRDQRQHQLKQMANTDANGRNGVAGVTAGRGAGVSYWHQQQQAMSMQVHPVSGPTVDGSRVGDDVDESIRKLLLKLGGSPFAAMAPACAPLPPPMYDDAPTFVAPSVHAASLAEGAVQCPSALPALELDECFHFNQVKLDGLDCFFGMAGGGVVMAEQSAAPSGHVHKWSEVSPLVCPSMVATSQGMHPYSLIEEPVNLVMQ